MSDSLSLGRTGIIQRLSIRFGGSKPKELERFLKFMVVGTIGAIIDLGLTNICLSLIFHVQPGQVTLDILSSAIGFTVAVCSNFLWNRYWTYPDSRSRPLGLQLAQFFAVNVVGLGIRAVVVGLLAVPFEGIIHRTIPSIEPSLQAKLGANMAVVIALGIVMLWNFFINRYWTYNDVK